LKKSHLNFYGNIEGNDIFKGTTDVIVCDGFVGNVSLKTTEGLAKMFASFLSQEFKKNMLTQLLAYSFEHALITAYEEAKNNVVLKITKQLKIDQSLI